MAVSPQITHRLKWLVLILFSLMIAPGNALSETSVEPKAEQRPTELELDVLPTLKGHMARLGTLMNVLFRDVDDPERQTEVLTAIEEMTLILENVGARFEPIKVVLLSDKGEKAAVLSGFQNCIRLAVEALDEMAEQLNETRFDMARQTLLDLDALRRDCHSKYAGG